MASRRIAKIYNDYFVIELFWGLYYIENLVEVCISEEMSKRGNLTRTETIDELKVEYKKRFFNLIL